MAEPNTTPQYQLEKPGETDFYDVEVQNRNADKIEVALKGLESSLSKKANKSKDLLVGDDIDTYRIEGAYRAASAAIAQTIANLPIGVTAAFELQVNKMWGNDGVGVTQILTTHVYDRADAAMFFRCYSGEVWKRWLKLATATPLQEFGLPVVEGVKKYEGACRYWKTQNNVTTIVAHITSENRQWNNRTIAILPTGFRPSATHMYPVTGVNGASPAVGYIRVLTSGEILLTIITGEAVSIFITGSFVATS